MDSTYEEQRAVIRFLLEEGQKPVFILNRLQNRFRDSCMSRSAFYSWVARFRDGRNDVHNRHGRGRPACIVTPQMVKNVESYIMKDRRVTLQEVANRFSISKGSVFKIVRDNLGLSKVSARWVPKQLSADQKLVRKTTSKDLLARHKRQGDGFLHHIVTGDETWIHHSEPESKVQSKQWVRAGSPPPKKFKLSPSAGKVMAIIFWDYKGVVLTHYVPKGRTVTANYYSDVVLPKLKANLCKLRPRLRMKNVVLQHDNAPAHTATKTKDLLKTYKWETLQHPPYSPDLAPSDFYLFPELKKMLAGNKYANRGALIGAVNQYLRHRPTSWFTAGIMKLPHRWNKCIMKEGEYFEKE